MFWFLVGRGEKRRVRDGFIGSQETEMEEGGGW